MKTITAAVLAAISAASMAQGIGIDTSEFTAYAAGPGGVVAISARAPCSIKEHAKSGWRLAKWYRGEGDTGVDACWKNAAKPYTEVISVCLIAPENPSAFLNCAPSYKADFREAKNLPRVPSFQ